VINDWGTGRSGVQVPRQFLSKNVRPNGNKQMPDLLSESDFTDHFRARLEHFNIPMTSPQPLVVELNYGEGEPVLAIPINNVYDQYVSTPEQLDSLIEPYVVEIGWTVQPPRYPARQVFEGTMPLMKDILLDPIVQESAATVIDGEEIKLTLPKGPLVYQDLIVRSDEHLIVQFMLKVDDEALDLHRGDVITCFPEPSQLATIAIQNLGKRALASGLTTRVFKVENFQTEPFLIGFRSKDLEEYVASLVNVGDVMLALEKNLEAEDGMLVIIPARDQMLVSTVTHDQAVCEMWLLARHLKSESSCPVSGLIWRFREGDITAVQTVNLQEEGQE